MSSPLRLLTGCFLIAVTSCTAAGPQRSALPYAAESSVVGTAGQHIEHVVVMVQENRTFDMIFAGYPRANSKLSGYNSKHQLVHLAPIDFTDKRGDIGHAWNLSVRSYDNGKMDEFDKNFISLTNKPAHDYPYSYLKRSEVQPYWAMAQGYVLADHMFPTEFGSSFTGHQDLIAGTTEVSATSSVADNPTQQPWGCGAPSGTVTNLVVEPAGGKGLGTWEYDKGPRPCYTHVTLANELDAKNVSWKYYAPAIGTDAGGTLWSAFSAIQAVYHGPDWKNVVSPPQTILTDVRNGTLPAVSWVIPDFVNSDHPGAQSPTGPSWVASVVNAIGKSRYWDSTAIVVVWDDYGGWYDNVPPPQLDYVGLAIRVPCLIVSPYARHGVVDHTQYEFGSILKSIEQIFGLPSMGTSDARAAGMLGAFDFTRGPRTFVPIPATYSTQFFRNQPASGLPPDND
ncbi:MAG: hypothetical protein JO192_10540 [Candidatus Eremiobacteraeota bacterium]|nr:hypothetical protein [Candidatus Eremiobacteraeota bacterium]